MQKPRIVKNWRDAWKWHSTQALAFIALAPMIWAELPPEAKELLTGLVPAQYHSVIITIVAVVGIVLRLRDQSGPQQ